MGSCLYRHEWRREAGVNPEQAGVRPTAGAVCSLRSKANISSIYAHKHVHATMQCGRPSEVSLFFPVTYVWGTELPPGL